jgi:hypothetical protein
MQIKKQHIITILTIILIYIVLRNILIYTLKKVENLENGETQISSRGILPAFLNTLVTSNEKINNVFSNITDTDVTITKKLNVKDIEVSGNIGNKSISEIEKNTKKILTGQITFNNCNINDHHSHEVKFSNPFSSPPLVFITSTKIQHSIWSPSVIDVTSTSFKISHRPGYANNNTYSWMAIENEDTTNTDTTKTDTTKTDTTTENDLPPPPSTWTSTTN